MEKCYGNDKMVTLPLSEYDELREFKREMEKNSILYRSHPNSGLWYNDVFITKDEAIKKMGDRNELLISEYKKLNLEMMDIKEETTEKFLKMSLYKFWKFRRSYR